MAKRRTTSDRFSPPLNASKEHLTHHSGINPVNQSSDDTAGVFEGIIKVDDSFAPYFLPMVLRTPTFSPRSSAKRTHCTPIFSRALFFQRRKYCRRGYCVMFTPRDVQ